MGLKVQTMLDKLSNVYKGELRIRIAASDNGDLGSGKPSVVAATLQWSGTPA